MSTTTIAMDNYNIADELVSAEKALEETERKLLLAQDRQEEERQHLHHEEGYDDYDTEDNAVLQDTSVAHLIRLEQTTNHLLLVQDVAEWVKTCTNNKTEDKQQNQDDNNNLIVQETFECSTLAELLCRHPPNPSPDGSMHQQLYSQEYVPLYTYLKSELVLSIRRSLKRAKYPTIEGCTKLLEDDDDDEDGSLLLLNSLVSYCQCLIRIDAAHQNLMQHLRVQPPSSNQQQQPKGIDLIVLELCRPFVERVRYHFVDKSGNDDRPTSNRIDRLPEWLFSYIREHFFVENGPWDLIVDGIVGTAAAVEVGGDDETSTKVLIDLLPVYVLNELIRIIQWVFNERNFWRHPKICGQASNPSLLCNAIQQLLLMDQDLQGALLSSSVSSSTPDDEALGAITKRRLLSLMDIFVAGDEELLHWWLQREKETVFATLFDDKTAVASTTSTTTTETQTSAGVNNALVVHPRAELFCALITSMQIKTSLFSFSAPYWNHVASPLCMQFVDMVTDKVLDLKQDLIRLDHHGGGFHHSKSSSSSSLKSNLMEWIQLVNGVHMATQTLLDGGDGDENGEVSDGATANQDVIRFGKSLQNLEQVLVDDFAKTFVETVLMEQAKLAGYLMRCSTLLLLEEKEDWMTAETNTHLSLSTSMSSDDIIAGGDDTDHTLSPDLVGTVRLLHRFLRVCDSAAAIHMDTDDNNEERVRQIREMAEYAPRAMCERVLTLLSEKLMEVAMNWHDMTPDLYYYGCTVFAGDIEVLFGLASNLPAIALRLIEIVTKLMAMPSQQLGQIGQALCGLAGQPAPLTEEVFLEDDRLYAEAMSMVRAKGLMYAELDDVLSILNRRRELNTGF